MVKKVFEKNKNILIPIPSKIVRHIGLQVGSYVKVTDDGYRIIITPEKSTAHDFSGDELDKIEKLAKQKGGKRFKDGNAFLNYLEKISKK